MPTEQLQVNDLLLLFGTGIALLALIAGAVLFRPVVAISYTLASSSHRCVRRRQVKGRRLSLSSSIGLNTTKLPNPRNDPEDVTEVEERLESRAVVVSC